MITTRSKELKSSREIQTAETQSSREKKSIILWCVVGLQLKARSTIKNTGGIVYSYSIEVCHKILLLVPNTTIYIGTKYTIS